MHSRKTLEAGYRLWAGIEGEIVVFKGWFDPVLLHATGVSGDTEGDVCCGGDVLVLAEGA